MSYKIEITSSSLVKRKLGFTGSNKVYLFDPGIKQVLKWQKSIQNKEYQNEMCVDFCNQ